MPDLPDFDEMFTLAERAAHAKSDIIMLEGIEDATEAHFMRAAIENKNYWLGGKSPTATVHLPKIVAKVGNTDEDHEMIVSIRERLAHANLTYTEAIEKLKIYHAMIAIYQTESANKRVALN